MKTDLIRLYENREDVTLTCYLWDDSPELLNGKNVKIFAKAGQGGKLFGSVTAKEVSEEIKKQFGVEVDKRKVEMGDIKAFGTFPCEVKLYTGVSASLYVVVGEQP